MTGHSMASEYLDERKSFYVFLEQIEKPLYNALKYLVRKHINKEKSGTFFRELDLSEFSLDFND